MRIEEVHEQEGGSVSFPVPGQGPIHGPRWGPHTIGHAVIGVETGDVPRNPRVQIRHIQKILRDTRSPVTILLEIYKEQRWIKDSIVRTLFCAHPFAPIEKVMEFLPALPLPGLKTLARNRNLRQQIQDKVEQLLKAKTGR